ncbi:Transcriptional regulator, contains XRE-family HTH domain [Evansella caseinilytica]|uniref:Transcriptional regulator, contains XRE-family HTH domain n=1 Tax=Evansella caseinilytica TaxID=1503961 RepID=A0A1H3UBD2_9BACI|nr:helix-turn-helix transcriptional regulator [Evansella caseinilytica]SDZ59742.1 Transcriptional regulator, contains XRE-family HTH domain [Evansella caseinilytica]
MSFGKYLKTKRKEKNFSMNKLGELTGITAMYISQLESGKRVKPSIEVLEKLSGGLEVPYEDLMVAAGYIDPDEYAKMKNERDDIEESKTSDKHEQYYLDFLLGSSHPLYYQDRLLTSEEKAKIKSLIDIVLKD